MKKLIVGIVVFVIVFLFAMSVAGQTIPVVSVEKPLTDIDKSRKIIEEQEKQSAILQLMIHKRQEKLKELKAEILRLNKEVEDADANITVLNQYADNQKQLIKIFARMAVTKR